jgi:TPR repeat protein
VRPAAAGSSAPETWTDEAFRKGKEFYQKDDYVEATRWYRTAADRGHVRGQIWTGNLYAEGQGVPPGPWRSLALVPNGGGSRE